MSTNVNGFIFRNLSPFVLASVRAEYGKTSTRPLSRRLGVSVKLIERLARALRLPRQYYFDINGKRFDIKSKQYVEIVRRDFGVKSNVQIAKECGCNVHLVSDIASALGLVKKQSRWYEINGYRFQKDVEKIVDDFKRDFPFEETSVVARRYGFDKTTARKLATALGIEKDAGYLHDLQNVKLRKAHAKLKQVGYNSGNLIKYGKRFDSHIWDNVTPEEKARRIAKGTATRKATFAAEVRRVNWGLPQRTKMTVVAAPRGKICARSRLKRVGYTESAEKYTFIRPADGVQHQIMEQHLIDKYGFRFIDDEKQELYND